MYTRALDRLFRVRSLVGSIRKAFSPRDLFSTGANGVWYDPSDYGTLFQDAAGTTPVTAMEQPVGLMLDKSKGLVLGSELITNAADRDFSVDTGWWVKEATVTISGGTANWSSSSNSWLYRTNLLTIGKFYQVTWTVSSYTAGVFRLTGGETTGPNRTAAGTYTEIYYASSAATLAVAGIGATGSVDNISVRELPGNHAFNPSGNSANFPVLSARYNLLTKTEDFSDAVWSKSSVSLASGATDPSGGTSAFTLTATSNYGNIFQSGVRLGTFVSSIWIRRKSGSGVVQILSADGNVWVSVTVTSQWTRFEDTKTSTNPGGTGVRLFVSGDAVDIAFADLRVANDALNQPAYQRVNTATDYDTVGFKPYLSFNGVNQWLQTNSIDFTYGDKMFVSAGVRKLSDAAQFPVIVELSSGLNVGSCSLYSNGNASNLNAYCSSLRGSSGDAYYYLKTFASPITNVVSLVFDIAGATIAEENKPRVNGTTPTLVVGGAGPAGTGNYGNYPLYLGARAGSSLWFNGRLYGLIIVGKAVRSVEITSTEAWLNNKTRAY